MDNRPTETNYTPMGQPQDISHTDSLLASGAGSLPRSTPPKNHRKAILLVIAVAIICGVAALVFGPKNCFDANNYKELVALAQNFEGGEGTDISTVSQGQELFTQSIYFQEASADILPEFSVSSADLFRNLGQYYRDHQAKAPIAIVVESSYPADTSPKMARERAQMIKDSLVQAGVAESSITVPDPVAVEQTDDSLYDDDFIDGMPVGIRVTPVSRCEM